MKLTEVQLLGRARAEYAFMLRAERLTYKAIGHRLGVSTERARQLTLQFGRRLARAMRRTRFTVGGSQVGEIADKAIADCAAAAERAKTSPLIIMHQGMFNLQVCAPRHMTREEVQAEANRIHVCGTTGGWQIADKDAESVQCASYQVRVHWILEA